MAKRKCGPRVNYNYNFMIPMGMGPMGFPGGMGDMFPGMMPGTHMPGGMMPGGMNPGMNPGIMDPSIPGDDPPPFGFGHFFHFPFFSPFFFPFFSPFFFFPFF